MGRQHTAETPLRGVILRGFPAALLRCGDAPQSLAENVGSKINALTPSLRAKRSNPVRRARDSGLLRRFAPRKDELKCLLVVFISIQTLRMTAQCHSPANN
uniref:Uncharacterized protein n=1 Tax=Rhodopseudomonas palustris (strain BisA53) TaxID=316055 RepID=Q07JL1_RHOP5